MHPPLILITNDDGYQAAGIQVLTRAVAPLGDVYVVAPAGARSGAACAISSTNPVSFATISPTHDPSPVKEGGKSPSGSWLPSLTGEGQGVGLSLFTCTGTPVDCIKLACERIVPRRPDLILSGINHGDNASVSAHYSGTIGAVIEGCLKGIPSIGFSLYLKRGETYEQHAVPADTLSAITKLCDNVLHHGLPDGVCLNVNIPQANHFGGWSVCRQSRGQWTAEWNPTPDPQTFRLTGTFIDQEPDATDTDFSALRAGRCSIVPIRIDLTAYEAIPQINKLTL